MTSLILERLKQISAARPKIFTEQQMPSLIAITDQPRQAAWHEDCWTRYIILASLKLFVFARHKQLVSLKKKDFSHALENGGSG